MSQFFIRWVIPACTTWAEWKTSDTKMGKGSKVVMVLLQSLAGSGHCIIKTRPKLADKLERILYDPFVGKRVLYKEKKKIRTL